MTGKNLSSEPLGLLKIRSFVLFFPFFFFLEKPKPRKREKGGRNEKQEKYFFLLDSETEMIGLVLSVPWQASSAGPQKRNQETRSREGKVRLFSNRAWKMLLHQRCLMASSVLIANVA